MEPGEALGVAAQIAVALAGFAGVVVVFRSGSLHEWPPIDKYRLWLLLTNAVLPLVLCLVAILLLTIRPTPHSIWHWCSGFSVLLLVPFGFLNMRATSRLGPSAMKSMGGFRYVFYSLSILGTAIVFLQIYNAAFPGVFWLFFTAIVFQLIAGMVQFVRMILLPPQKA